MKVGRVWIWGTIALVALSITVVGYRWLSDRDSLAGRFERVKASMSENEVLAIMGPAGDRRSERRVQQVSEYADVWRLQDGLFVRKEYRGRDVHTQVELPSPRCTVWKTDEGVAIIGFDADGRVCYKIRLTE